MLMPILTKKDQTMNGWRMQSRKVSVSVLSMVRWNMCVVVDLEKIEAIPISFMTWKSKASKRTILSTSGAEASSCRDALDLAEYTRAMLCEAVIGERVLPDEWGGGALVNPSDHGP